MVTPLVLICLGILILVLLLKSPRPKNFPPGPPVLPLLGNILELTLENPLQDFERLRKTYGNIYSLYLGRKPAVVISGLKTIKEALVTKGSDFSGRPQDMFINDALKKNGKTLSPHLMFHNAASNIICQVLFGTRYEYDDHFIREMIRCFTENAKISNGPWVMRGMDKTSFSENRLPRYALDLHFAGTDTTSNTLLTGFLYLMNHPHVQGMHLLTLSPGDSQSVHDNELVTYEARSQMPYMQLRKTYGNIYSLYLGRKPAVVISGLKTIKEALVTKGSDFSGRPQDMFINDAIKTNGVVLQDYDNAWKDHRRFALMTLRNFGMGKTSMEDRINGEIEYIVNTLEKSNGKTLSPHLMFHNAASNIICQVLFGTRYEYDDHFIREMIRCFTENAKISNGPWVMRGMDKTSFSESRLPMYALDLHFAGTDTTSNTLLTGFLYLMNHPHVQAGKTYGNIYSLYLGSRPAVVISGLKTIKEALVTKGSDFSGRPQDMFINDAIRTAGVEGVWIPKMEDSKNISQFRTILL
ncbi:unnamed protein product [Tetraodon nigroviridis]|uniref:(spotted green pufferfish) hypothetical protein n=1 Tax=Tetraodon nigroviridis TaxID=99883 RepID=Q4STF7_TETNG|nr:unnamed protein product [Tetraodon nigroviridis]